MDKDWFDKRMRLAGVSQDDLGRAIGRDRSAATRILSGERELRLSESEKWADLLKAPAIEVIRHAYPWSRPFDSGPGATLDVELLRIAIERAEIALRDFVDRDVLFAGTIAGAYVFLERRRRAGAPIDAAALAALDEAVTAGLLSRRG